MFYLHEKIYKHKNTYVLFKNSTNIKYIFYLQIQCMLVYIILIQ